MGYTYEQLKQMGATPIDTVTTTGKKKYTYDELVKAGAVATKEAPLVESKASYTYNPDDSFGESALKTVGNIPSSLWQVGKGLTSVVAHPIETAKGLTGIVAGGVQKLIPGEQEQEKSFDAVVDFYKNRYGSMEAFKKALVEDPAGVGLDASVAFTGGGAALTKAGNISKISKLAKTGQTLTKAGDITNPVLQGTKLFGKGVALSKGKSLGGKKYTTDNIDAAAGIGVAAEELPIFAKTTSPISTTAEAVASKGLGGAKIWERMDNIYNKMNDTVDSLLKGRQDATVIGVNISNAVDSFKNNFYKVKNDLYKEAIIPKAKALPDEIPGMENVKNFTSAVEDPAFAQWNKTKLPDGRIRYTKPTKPLFDGKNKPMVADTTKTRKLINSLIENEKQALIGYGKKTSLELQTYQGLGRGLANKNLSTSDVYRTLQKLSGDIKFGTTIKTGNNAKLSLIRETLDAEFLATLKVQRPDLAKALDAADNYYKEGVKKLNSGIIQAIVKNADRPDLIVKTLLPKLKSVEDVKLLVEVLGQKNMAELRKSILSEIFTEAKGVGGNNLKPLGISKQVKKFGEDKLEILLNPDQLKAVYDLEQISKMMGKSSKITGGSQTSFNLLSTVGGGSVATSLTLLFMGNPSGAILSLSPLMGTVAASKFINSNLGRKLMTEGFEFTGKTGEKIQAASEPIGTAGQASNVLSNIYESQ